MKDYKRILQGVVNIINITKKSDIGFANICTYIGENCPELAKGEDERVRKELLDFCKNRAEKYPNDPNYKNISAWIAWLEKQKAIDVLDEEEREFADNVDSYRKEIDAAYQKGYNEGVKATLEKQVSACLSHDDEIMIEQLTEYFTTGHGLQNTNETVVAWLNDVKRKLEKQGEQKPYGQRQECADCQFNYAGECKGYCAMKRGEQKPAIKLERDDNGEPVLTPFEAELFTMMSEAWQGYLLGEEVNIAKIVKEHSIELLKRANEQKPVPLLRRLVNG